MLLFRGGRVGVCGGTEVRVGSVDPWPEVTIDTAAQRPEE